MDDGILALSTTDQCLGSGSTLSDWLPLSQGAHLRECTRTFFSSKGPPSSAQLHWWKFPTVLVSIVGAPQAGEALLHGNEQIYKK